MHGTKLLLKRPPADMGLNIDAVSEASEMNVRHGAPSSSGSPSASSSSAILLVTRVLTVLNGWYVFTSAALTSTSAVDGSVEEYNMTLLIELQRLMECGR